jgi:flagellar basal body-associated protein FliL
MPAELRPRPQQSEPNRGQPILAGLDRALRVAVGLAVAAILAGSVYRLFRPAPRPAAEAAPALAAGAAEGAANATVPVRDEIPAGPLFRDIGALRVATVDDPPATVIVDIVFPYDSADTAFAEEVAAHTREYREQAVALFGRYRAAELGAIGEDKLKSELLRRFNSLLRLGSIEAVYFEEFLVVE